VIANASLQGGASLGLQRAAGIFERRCFAWSGHRRRHRASIRQENSHVELLQPECVPGRSGARLCNSCRNFRAALVRVERAPQRSIAGQAASLKNSHVDTRDCECPRRAAPDSASTSCRTSSGAGS
jgi:hypothetical protein